MPSVYNGIQNNTDPCWWKDRSLRLNMVWVFVTAITHITTGYDASLLGSLQATPKFWATFPKLITSPSLIGVVGALLFLPGLVVPFFGAWVSDRFGRKLPMIIGTSGQIISTIIQATAQQGNLTQFAVGRALMGASGSFAAVPGLAIVAELCHPRFRAPATAMQVAVYYIGSILASWTTYGCVLHMVESSWSWRVPVLLQAGLPCVILPFLIFMPESPRFLISTGRVDEARASFARLHANGDIADPLVNFEVEEVTKALERERQNKTGWSALWATKGNRWRMFIVINTAAGSQLNGVGIISYWLVPVLKSLGITSYLRQNLIQGGLAISNFFIATFASILVDRIGRRPLWLTSTGIMLMALTVITALSAEFTKTGNKQIATACIGFLYVFYGGYDLAWSPLNSAYTVEVLNYHIRAKGLAVWTFTTYASLSFNTWVNSVALSAIGWKYYLVYIVVLVYLFTVIFFFYPETKNLTLEEVSHVFDKDSDEVHDRDEVSANKLEKDSQV